ncbi:hypothetical protein M9H77_30549 [Catharanthus roseus]|uniref:Uncharacterized protein n=1 Tax=Catharanthus roseus TaxID=4058 RepID=A0ACB9ZYW0_CATRO|nr:hypothetical protein M9H77_30549 [Catharanthus roseus]
MFVMFVQNIGIKFLYKVRLKLSTERLSVGAESRLWWHYGEELCERVVGRKRKIKKEVKKERRKREGGAVADEAAGSSGVVVVEGDSTQRGKKRYSKQGEI